MRRWIPAAALCALSFTLVAETAQRNGAPEGLIVRTIGIEGTERAPLADGDAIGYAETLGLELSHPIDPAVLSKALEITPAAPHRLRIFGKRMTLDFRKLPSTAYEIAIPAGLTATDGYVTERSVLHVHTDAVPHVAPLRQTPGEPYRYGTLGHPFPNSLAGPQAERIMDAFATAGVRFVRLEFPAAQILGDDTPKANPDFTTLDRITEGLLKRGITVYPGLTQYTVPKFQAQGKGYPNLQSDPNDFGKYAGIVAEHLKRYPKITRMEIFNEPNAFHWWVYPTQGGRYDDQSGKAAAAYMKAAYAAIKRANPTMLVGGPELSSGGRETDPRTYLTNMYDAGCGTGKCWDFLTVHNYRWDNPTYHVAAREPNRWDIYKDLQQIAVAHGDAKPHVMLTEWGYSTIMSPDGFDPAVQAYFMALGFNLMLQDPTVDGIVWVNVYNGGPADNFYAQTQLMKNDFTPLAGYSVFADFSKGSAR